MPLCGLRSLCTSSFPTFQDSRTIRTNYFLVQQHPSLGLDVIKMTKIIPETDFSILHQVHTPHPPTTRGCVSPRTSLPGCLLLRDSESPADTYLLPAVSQCLLDPCGFAGRISSFPEAIACLGNPVLSSLTAASLHLVGSFGLLMLRCVLPPTLYRGINSSISRWCC